MNLKYLRVISFTGLLGMITLTAQEAVDENTASYRFETYQVISQRNIFSRNRRPVQTRTMDKPVQKKSVVLSLYVLKGIAMNGPQKIAFIEEEVSGNVIKATIGTEILNGRIKDIRSGYVIFEENGQERQIQISELFGKNESLQDAPSDSEDSPVPEKTKSSEDTTSGEDDILKKMLERRKSELGT